MNFVAIDFETANEKRNSPCSLGIVVVKNNEIVEEKLWLIKPKELRFESMNTWIHGITENDVIDKPEFDEIWNEIEGYLSNSLVVAHNASFDISVLRRTLDLYSIPYPSFTYCCTMIMSRNFYPYLENSKLNTVNKHLGFDFNHHDALEDARGAANILINISNELESSSIDELSRIIEFTIGRIDLKGYMASSKRGAGRQISKRSEGYKRQELIINKDAFREKVVVFTGPLSTMKRADAMILVRRAGGSTGSSVTRKTNILVTGGKNLEKIDKSRMSTKLRRATSLIECGQKISIITEDEFLKVIGNYR